MQASGNGCRRVQAPLSSMCANVQVVYAPAIERMLKSVQSTDVTVHRLPHAMHDLLLGPEEPEVTKLFIDWIEQHTQ